MKELAKLFLWSTQWKSIYLLAQFSILLRKMILKVGNFTKKVKSTSYEVDFIVDFAVLPVLHIRAWDFD